MCDVSPRIREGRETWHIKLAREGEGGAMANTQTYGFPIYAADWIRKKPLDRKSIRIKRIPKMASSRRHRWPPGAASRWPAEAERDEAGSLTSS